MKPGFFRLCRTLLLACLACGAAAQPAAADGSQLTLPALLGLQAGFDDPLNHPLSGFQASDHFRPAAAAGQPSFRLNQDYRQPFAAEGASLSLAPSVSIPLYDPLRSTETEFDRLQGQLETLELQREAGLKLLAVHQNAATVQHLLMLSELLDLYLAALPALPAAAGHDPAAPVWSALEQAVRDPAAWKRENDRLDHEETYRQAQAGIHLFSLALEAATGQPAAFFGRLEAVHRPRLEPGAEEDLYTLCISNSNQLQRLQLWQEQQLIRSRQRELRSRPAVSLDLATRLSLTGLGVRPQSELSWSLGLHVAAPALADATFNLDLHPWGVSQRSSFRWPHAHQGQQHQPDPDHEAAARTAVLNLLQLLDHLESASRTVQRLQLPAAGSHALLLAAARGEAPPEPDLPGAALDSALSLLQAQLDFDLILLELAAVCKLPVSYRPDSYLP
jgi:hypothetical protein